MFNLQIYKNRRDVLRQKMGSGLILLPGNIESPMNYLANTYHYRQDSTFLYYFGLDIPGLIGLIDVDNNRDWIFGNDIDIDDIIWMGIQPSVKDLSSSVGVENSAPLKELENHLEKSKQAGATIHYIPPYRAENKLLLKDLLHIKPDQLSKSASLSLIKAVVSQRSIKEAVEIAEIEKACAIGYDMHVTAMRMAKAGVSEQHIAGFIEGIALSRGKGTAFPTILTQNGETLHNHDHSHILQSGRLMLVDAGAQSNLYYASDFTRTIPVGGKFTQKQLDIYNIVLATNDHSASMVKPGVTYQSIHLAASKIIASGLIDLELMKGNVDEAVEKGAHALFFPHGLGHMMGLDVHDMEDYGEIHVGYNEETAPVEQFGTAYLRMGRKLEPGYVITNEPGIYFIPALIDKWEKEGTNKDFINFDKVRQYLGFGGIRLEDDILVTETGGRLLGNRIPIYPSDLEAIVGHDY